MKIKSQKAFDEAQEFSRLAVAENDDFYWACAMRALQYAYGVAENPNLELEKRYYADR